MCKEQLLALVYEMVNRYDHIANDTLCGIDDYDRSSEYEVRVAIAAVNTYNMMKYAIIFKLVEEDKPFSEESSLLELVSSYTFSKDIYDERILHVAQKINLWNTAAIITNEPLGIDVVCVEECVRSVLSIWYDLTGQNEE